MRKHRNDVGENNRNISQSDSFALFGDSSESANNNNNVDLFDSDTKKAQKPCSTKQSRPRHSDEKPELSEHNIAKDRPKVKRGFRALKVNKVDTGTTRTPSDNKGQDNTKRNGKDKDSGSKSGKLNATDSRLVNQTRQRKQKVQASQGGSGVHEDDDAVGKTVAFDSCPVGVFDFSSTIQRYTLQARPRKIDEFDSEIIIDGKRYKVASCSIINGEYIQGLDSNFLVHKYRGGKKHSHNVDA